MNSPMNMAAYVIPTAVNITLFPTILLFKLIKYTVKGNKRGW